MRRLGWVIAVVAATFLGGCGGDDDDPVKPPPGGNPGPTGGPQSTLENMRLAYVARDSIETKQVYDSNYVGTSIDLNDPGSPATFRWDDEVRHVAALAHSQAVVSIVLDLGPSSSWTRMSSDDPSHPEWAMIKIGSGNFHCEVVDTSITTYSVTSTNPMTFYFTPRVTAPGDTTWKIVRWNEIGTSGI